MSKRLLIIAALALSLSGRTPLNRYTFHHENVLGTSLEMHFDAASPEAADIAEAAALAEIDREAEILSAYSSTSEFSRWFRTSRQPVHVSAELFEVLSLFDQWKQHSNGALDASAEAVVRLWKRGRVPTPQELAVATAAVRQPHWSLDSANQTATHLDATPLALNSFTKSYIVSRAADAALATGVASAVVNIGGDLVVRGSAAEVVSIADPRSDSENGTPLALLQVRDLAVATSGDYRRGFDIAGRHYSHIVDPRTGQPAADVISSTVVAQDAAEAGALATIFSVLNPDESAQLAATRPGVEYLLIASNGAKFESAGWKTLLLAAPQSKPVAADSSELVVNLELNRIEGQRVRRPYVAIWIEDKDKFPLRTVALWFDKPRWLPELKAWTHADRLRSMAEGTDITSSVSSATRQPGKYTFKWDGKDNQGKPVKPGKYTVMIEVAREHGTYQLMHQDMDFNGVPKQVELPANPEVASASLVYRK